MENPKISPQFPPSNQKKERRPQNEEMELDDGTTGIEAEKKMTDAEVGIMKEVAEEMKGTYQEEQGRSTQDHHLGTHLKDQGKQSILQGRNITITTEVTTRRFDHSVRDPREEYDRSLENQHIVKQPGIERRRRAIRAAITAGIRSNTAQDNDDRSKAFAHKDDELKVIKEQMSQLQNFCDEILNHMRKQTNLTSEANAI